MKLRIFSTGLFLLLALINVTSGLPASEGSPVSVASKTTKTINENHINSSTIKTTSTKVLPIATPTLTLNPTDLWYVGSDNYYHKIISTKYDICGLDKNNVRSIISYRDCLDMYDLEFSISRKYITTTKVPTNSGTNSGTKSVTCPTKGGWYGMYMSSAISDCNSHKAALIHYGSCRGNSPYYVCSASYTKHLDGMTFVETFNPSYMHKKRDISSNVSDERTSQRIKATKTLPFIYTSSSSSSETHSPSENLYLPHYIEVATDGNYCCDCSNSIYKCCHPDQEQSVALVDNHGIWGIQLFDQKYDWCLYPPTHTTTTKPLPIITTTTTTPPSSTCIPLTISTTITERETVTKKKYVTVTVTE